MDTTIIVSFIAGGIAVITAAVSAVVAIVSVKRNNLANRELEYYRHTLKNYEVAEDISKRALENRIETLGEACTTIQEIRDDIRTIQATNGKDISARKRYVENANKLAKIYSNAHFGIGAVERSILHDARALARSSAYSLVDYQTPTQEIKSEIPPLDSSWWKDLTDVLNIITQAQDYLVREYQRLLDIVAHMPLPSGTLLPLSLSDHADSPPSEPNE